MNCIKFRMSVCTLLRNIAMLVIILSGSTKTVAQEWDHEYFPFVEEGKVWNCFASYSSSLAIGAPESITCIFTMSGDTLINENTYKKVSCQFKDFYGDEEQHYYCAVREEDYRVFIVEAETKEEKMLYDFSHPQEDILLSNDDLKYVRGAGYEHGFLFPRRGQLCFMLFEGDEINDNHLYNNEWIEGVGSYLCNPFAVVLPAINIIDPFFGYPFVLISCMKDEKCMFYADWMIRTYNPEEEKWTSIHEMSKSTSDAPIYDLQGRCLSATPQKGVYIQDGKKKLVK